MSWTIKSGMKMKILFLILKNLKIMIKRHDKYLFISFLGLAVTVMGVLFYFGYFLRSFYTLSMSTECEIELESDNKSSDVYVLTKKLIELSDDVYSFCISSPNSQIKLKNGTSLSVAGYYDDNWKEMLHSGKTYSIDETDSKVMFPIHGVSNIGINNDEPLIGHILLAEEGSYEVNGLVDYIWDAKLAIPPLYYANNFTCSKIKIIWKNTTSELEKRGLEECLTNPIISSSVVKDNTNPMKDSSLRQISGIELIAFGIMCINVFVLVYFWLDKNKYKNYIYALCGASENKVRIILLGITVIPMFTSVLFGMGLYVLVYFFVRNYGIVYDESPIPYWPIILMIFIVLSAFCLIVVNRTTKNRVIYKAVE